MIVLFSTSSHLITRVLQFDRCKPKIDRIRRTTSQMTSKSSAETTRLLTNGTMPLLDHQTMVWGNSDLIKQLLIILTENAIRYTLNEGSVLIRTRKLAGHVLIEVNDTGIGINERELPFIFERFFREELARIHFPAGKALDKNTTTLFLHNFRLF